jgi:hypothetical protein
MTPTEYLAKLPREEKELLTAIHEIILKTNPKVTAEVAPMMRQEMIQYKILPKGIIAGTAPKATSRYFVYGLASTKNYMSLHLMPMYAHKPMHEKYSKLLKKAKFQKGCINFKNADEMPLDIAEQLMADCAKIDWEAVMKKYGK